MSRGGQPVSGDAGDFSLVVPFTLCRSRGGPYDDDAFVSGYRIGSIAQAIASPGVTWVGLIRPDEREQLDLIAMDEGLVVQTLDTFSDLATAGEWIQVAVGPAALFRGRADD